MQLEIIDYGKVASYCLVYIDDLDEELKDLIDKNFLEIVIGKLEAERVEKEDKEEIYESICDAKKYISSKKCNTNRTGIVGELLFHSILRTEELSNKFLSLCPTIGYSDSYSQFYKGFDGCYYGDNRIWICEVKSKVESKTLDNDNKDKLIEASSQILKEVNDKENNRWLKAKKYVNLQHADAVDIFKLFRNSKRNEYNQLVCSMLICKNGEFNKSYIEKYIETLIHYSVPNQKIFCICIRNYDYEKIIEYVEKEVGACYAN